MDASMLSLAKKRLACKTINAMLMNLLLSVIYTCMLILTKFCHIIFMPIKQEQQLLLSDPLVLHTVGHCCLELQFYTLDCMVTCKYNSTITKKL